MKASFKYLLSILVLALILVSCSRKKDSFINRNFHAVTAEYNTLYNGYVALEEGKENLSRTYTDNYWDILPVERLELFDEVVLPGQSKNESFTRAEEKAVKAIQKHSMNIKGKEKNPQMDEAYLLLGKARYFDQRFVPALAAFNNILNKYPTSDRINQVKIWKAKSNIRLENHDLAIKNLKRLLRDEKLEDQDLADATSSLAQAYIDTKSLDSAVTQLNVAAQATKNNDERGRYRFIQGQLYNSLGYKDSANIAFDKIIKLHRKTPRIYYISAHLEKIKNFDYDKGNKIELHEFLTKLEEDRENRPYLDKIYYQIGEFHRTNESDSLAITYYNKSLRTNTRDKQLKANTYEILGNHNFDNNEYKIAGAYYDSTMINLVENSKPFRVIKKKRENLDDVIKYEGIAEANDSILSLVAMSPTEREAYFNNYIEQLKIAAEKAEEEKERQEQIQRNSGLAVAEDSNNSLNQKGSGSKLNSPGRGIPGAGAATVFYFYNPTTVAYGKNEFNKKWGDRQLEDNWRWSGKTGMTTGQSDNSELLTNATEEELYAPEFYLSKIPTEEKEIDSIKSVRNEAYYQLGLIYKEKFKEYGLAKDKLKSLLNSNPDEKYIVPAKYNLYKIYELLGETSEATIVKNEIINNYPETRYAQILQNPEIASSDDFESPENVYKKLYTQFENQEFQTVINSCENYLIRFDGDPIIPKLELLKATANGRLYGYTKYAEGVNYVALTFPNSEVGRQATTISSEVLPMLQDASFAHDTTGTNFKTVFKFTLDEIETLKKLRNTIEETAKDISYYEITVSEDVYNPNTIFLLIHGMKSEAGSYDIVEIIETRSKKKIKRPYFVISGENYRIIQIHKNLEAYLNRDSN